MANKNFLLSLCRYYKGEETTKLSGNDGMFWNCERVWVASSLGKNKDVLTDALNDYLNVGLRTFNMYDDTPITLKALLYNYFAKYFSGSSQEAADAFKKFYIEQYTKQ